MFSYTKDVEKLVRKLILHTTKEESIDSEISKECEKFVRSNLKHHRYLDVNSHAVQRTVEGLQTKFKVHNKIKEAELLDKLFTTFVESDVGENGAFSDFHFSCVSFLHLCANQPTENEFTPEYEWTKETEDDGQIKQWTDWLIRNRKANGFISEDEQNDGDLDSDLSDWGSDDEMLNDREASRNRKQEHMRIVSQQPIVDESSDVDIETSTDSEKSPIESESSDQKLSFKFVEFTFSNIDDRNFYWRQTNPVAMLNELKEGAHAENTFFMRSFSAIRSANPLMKPLKGSSICLTEVNVIRECIWALGSNQPEFVIFKRSLDDECLEVNKDIFVSHLSFWSLRKTLGKVLEIRSEISVVRKLCVEFESLLDCSVLTEFAECVRIEILQPFEKFLLECERKAMDDFKTFTLMNFYQEVSEWIPIVSLMSTICNEIFTTIVEILAQKTSTTCYLETHKLSLAILGHVNLIINKVLLGYTYPSTLNLKVFLQVFVSPWKAILRLLASWISTGTPKNFQELFFRRNHDVAVDSSVFWKSAFFFEVDVKRKLAVEDFNFFNRVLDVVKSAEMLTSAGKLLPLGFPSDIVRIFEDEIFKHFGVDFECKSSNVNPVVSKTLITSSILLETELVNTTDSPYIKNAGINFETKLPIYNRSVYQAKKSAFERILKELDVANELLLAEVKNQEMNTFIRSLTALYLFQSNSSEMHQFLFDLFEDIAARRKWKDSTMITLKLQDLFENSSGKFPEQFYENIVTSFKGEASSSLQYGNQNLINQLVDLSVMVDVDWPMSIVFSREVFATLNQVFMFLSQIKWAKFAITRLKLSSLAEVLKSADGNCSSLFYKLRFRIMHLVTVLETYFMTRVVHATHDILNENVKKAQNITELMESVETFASTLENRCLLNKESAKVRSALMSALNTVIVFVNLCEKVVVNGDVHVRSIVAGVEQSYKTFDKIYTFVQSLLRTLVKRGSFQHLESLAFALT